MELTADDYLSQGNGRYVEAMFRVSRQRVVRHEGVEGVGRHLICPRPTFDMYYLEARTLPVDTLGLSQTARVMLDAYTSHDMTYVYDRATKIERARERGMADNIIEMYYSGEAGSDHERIEWSWRVLGVDETPEAYFEAEARRLIEIGGGKVVVGFVDHERVIADVTPAEGCDKRGRPRATVTRPENKTVEGGF